MPGNTSCVHANKWPLPVSLAIDAIANFNVSGSSAERIVPFLRTMFVPLTRSSQKPPST